ARGQVCAFILAVVMRAEERRPRWEVPEEGGISHLKPRKQSGMVCASIVPVQFNLTSFKARRVRRPLLAIAALGLLGIWLLLTAAESCQPLHRWLHGGTVPDDDDCAVVMIASGKVDVAHVTVAVIPVLVAIIVLDRIFVPPLVPKLPLPPSRGPPFFCFSHLR